MFFELIAIGVFVAAALFNVEPANEEVPLDNGVREIKSTPQDWVAAFQFEQVIYYANPSSIRKSSRYKAKMWQLTDYPRAQINGDYVYFSKKSLEEYDCDIGQARLLYSALYEGKMGEGEALYTHSETYAWEPVVLDTDTAAMWKIACGRP
jgi:hypothetical protein